jgi:hypothetical protein
MTLPKTGRGPDSEFLSAESRSKIENEFDKTSAQIGFLCFAALRYFKRIIAVLLVLLAALYICDYISVRYRIPQDREPLGTVEVQRYYAVHLKSGKTEITYDGSENQVCTNSIFPHLGYDPCWYARRHTRKMMEI